MVIIKNYNGTNQINNNSYQNKTYEQRMLNRYETRIKRQKSLQRKLARQVKGSNNYYKTVNKLTKLSKKIKRMEEMTMSKNKRLVKYLTNHKDLYK